MPSKSHKLLASYTQFGGDRADSTQISLPSSSPPRPLPVILDFLAPHPSHWASQVVPVVKNPPANAGDIRGAAGLIPGLERSPGGEHDNSVQYSCLENSMDRDGCGLWSIGLQRVGHD